MQDCNPDCTPASQKPLGKDKEGPEFVEKWSYSSVVGVLLYLVANFQPEIAYAVHQFAQFTHDRKASHGNAMKRICQYLKGKKNNGMILFPSKQLTVDCFVDSDFAGQWNAEDPEDPLCVKSQTGYVLMVGNCPILWVSKLHTEIAVSTMEAEYIALSRAMQDLIPYKHLLIKSRKFSEIHCCLVNLTTMPQMTP